MAMAVNGKSFLLDMWVPLDVWQLADRLLEGINFQQRRRIKYGLKSRGSNARDNKVAQPLPWRQGGRCEPSWARERPTSGSEACASGDTTAQKPKRSM